METKEKKGFLASIKSIYSRKTLVFAVGRLNAIIFLSSLTMVYQVFVLNTIIGIPSNIYGIMASICTVVSLIFVPISGIIIQKVSMRWGVYRSWLYVTGLITCVFTFLLFTDLGMANGPAKYIYYGALVILTPNIFNMPSSAVYGLLPLCCKDSQSRTDSSAVNNQLNGLFKLLTGALIVPFIALLTNAFGKSKAYSIYALVCAVLMAIIYFICGWLAAPDDPSIGKGEQVKVEKKKTNATLGEMFKSLCTAGTLLTIFASLARNLGTFVITSTLAYYYNYVVGTTTLMAVYLGANGFVALFASFIAPAVLRVFKSPKKTYITSFVIQATCMLSAYFLGKNAVVFTVLLCLNMFGSTLGTITEVTIYADAVDYSCYKNKKDTRPFLMSCFTLPGKVSTTFAGAILGFALTSIAFDKAHVTAQAANGIRSLMSFMPGCFMIVALILMLFYPEKKYAEAKKQRENTEKQS